MDVINPLADDAYRPLIQGYRQVFPGAVENNAALGERYDPLNPLDRATLQRLTDMRSRAINRRRGTTRVDAAIRYLLDPYLRFVQTRFAPAPAGYRRFLPASVRCVHLPHNAGQVSGPYDHIIRTLAEMGVDVWCERLGRSTDGMCFILYDRESSSYELWRDAECLACRLPSLGRARRAWLISSCAPARMRDQALGVDPLLAGGAA